MKEYLTEAFVLDVKPSREQDSTADLYTKELGRLKVRVVGGRKSLSKFSPHLSVPNLITARLVKKGGFTLADVMTNDNFRRLRERGSDFAKVLELVFLLRKLVPLASPDLHLWYALLRALREVRISYRTFLKILGYDASGARCELCRSKSVSYFSFRDQSFLCSGCHVKFPANELVYMR